MAINVPKISDFVSLFEGRPVNLPDRLYATKYRRLTGIANTSVTRNLTWSAEQSASRRLLEFPDPVSHETGWIPRNSLEISKEYSEHFHYGAGAIDTARYGEFWRIDFIDPQDYFYTLQSCSTLDEYIKWLAAWKLTGASFYPYYIDPVFPDLTTSFTFRGFPDSVTLVGGRASQPSQEYAQFWALYWRAVMSIAGLLYDKFLANLTSFTIYDMTALSTRIAFLTRTLGNSTNPSIGIERLLALPVEVELYVNRFYGDSHTTDSQGRTTEGLRNWSDPRPTTMLNAEYWQTFKRTLGEFTQAFPIPVTEEIRAFIPEAQAGSVIEITVPNMLRRIWARAVQPYINQLYQIEAQYAWISDPTHRLTDEDYRNLADLAKNPFLQFSRELTEKFNAPTFINQAVSPIVQASTVAPIKVTVDAQAYKTQSYLSVPEVELQFKPLFSLPGSGGGGYTPPPKKSSLLPILLAGGAAAAAVYFSNR